MPPTQSHVPPRDSRADRLVRVGTPHFTAPDTERAFETFSYAVSHDLRAPLRAIEGYARAITEDFAGEMPASALDLVSRIRQATQTVEKRVDALLRLSRLSRGALRTARCDLADTARHLLDDLRHLEPGRRVIVNVAASIPVLGDATLLAIAFENLLSNAWKFTRGRATAHIDVETTASGEDVVIVVRDNGVGFDMRQAHRLGVPFQRLHAAEAFEGMGIGLASTRRIVERHGGRLWAESNPDQGAAFYVSLPAAEPR